jgi:hypothetical protein
VLRHVFLDRGPAASEACLKGPVRFPRDLRRFDLSALRVMANRASRVHRRRTASASEVRRRAFCPISRRFDCSALAPICPRRALKKNRKDAKAKSPESL